MDNLKSGIFQYVRFKSFVNPSFWHKLAEIKINIDKLDDVPRNIYGYYTNYKAKSCLLEVDYTSFNNDCIPSKNYFSAHGVLHNKNTIEDFKNCDKMVLLESEGKKFLEDITTGKVLNDCSLLARFFILSFADLKTNKFFYWFAFPVSINPIVKIPTNFKPRKLHEINELHDQLSKIYFCCDSKDKMFFIVKNENNCIIHKTLKDEIFLENKENNFVNQDLEKIFFCFTDPSEFEQPSWILRSYLAFLFETCPNLHDKIIQVIGIRQNVDDIKQSLIWNVIIPSTNENDKDNQKFVGWEMSETGKMSPKVAAMANDMDPARIAENCVNLNLKLMKWRLVPNLNLNIMKKTKCLLFGAGTLGCAVARNLLAWGFKNITIVDNGKVSFSNPVRQSLYKHEDAIDGSKMKAVTAANRILEIDPSAKAKGIVTQIPMPGHVIGDSFLEEVVKSLTVIEENVQEHDVLFLLTDSRESRWLPTLLGAFYKKIVINAALGFDSYLVMRHGSYRQVTNISEKKTDNVGLCCIPGSELGCYFCNDVTAPGDSTKNRTLDQQCTVTRPGVSNIAASYAVELLVSLLQHEYQDLAPAYFLTKKGDDKKNDIDIPEGLLGVIPHSIRGMLGTFENILPATTKFSQCVACSEKVLKEYQSRGKQFLIDVFNSTKYLEDLTGISDFEIHENEIIEYDDSNLDWSD